MKVKQNKESYHQQNIYRNRNTASTNVFQLILEIQEQVKAQSASFLMSSLAFLKTTSESCCWTSQLPLLIHTACVQQLLYRRKESFKQFFVFFYGGASCSHHGIFMGKPRFILIFLHWLFFATDMVKTTAKHFAGRLGESRQFPIFFHR